MMKTLMTVRCGVCVTSCVRNALAPIAAAAVRATYWSSTDTAEPTSRVSVVPSQVPTDWFYMQYAQILNI